MLQRFSLLYTDTHEPIFYGPGFVDIRYKLPLIWLGIVTFLATAVTAILFIFSEKGFNVKLNFRPDKTGFSKKITHLFPKTATRLLKNYFLLLHTTAKRTF